MDGMVDTMNSRDKGARYERHIAKVLREHGYEAERGQQHSGGKDSPDVKHNMKRIHIECKHVQHLNIWDALAQAERDCGDNIPIVVFKRNRSKDYVALSLEDFIAIYKHELV
jgi:hypothetical protein